MNKFTRLSAHLIITVALLIMKFFQCLCSCFRKPRDSPPDPVPQSNRNTITISYLEPEPVPVPAQAPVLAPAPAPVPVLVPVPIPAPVESYHDHHLKIIIDTKYHLSDLKMKDFTPATSEKQTLAYNCPICMRFFSTILTLKCCKQYICHYCISDLNEDVKFEVACPHCKASPIYVTDVDLRSSVKYYSDSPYGSLKTSARPGNKWLPMPIVDEDKDYDDDQIFADSLHMEDLKHPQEPANSRLTV